ARLDHHRRGDLLAQHRVRDADHGGLGDGRVLVQDLLDLPRVDVVAAPDDQVFAPVDDEVEAVVVDPGQVTAAEPAVRDRLGGGPGLPPVPLHDVVAADHDPADLAGPHVPAELVDEAELDAADRGADRPGPAGPVRVVEGGDRRGLGQAVTFEDHAAVRLF